LRPDHTFRGFAGQIASGTIRAGDSVTVQPSGRSAQVKRIVTFDGDLAEAYAPLSITLVLDRELDISRGDLIVSAEAQATVVKTLEAALVWMDERPLEANRRYLLKHTSHTVPASISSIAHRTNIATLGREPASTLEMNGIGVVNIEVLRPIALDLYSQNRATGAFILIDPETNRTVAAGMVKVAGAATMPRERVTAEERAKRWGHRGGVLELNGPMEVIDAVERGLFHAGVIIARIEASSPSNQLGLLALLEQSGILALVVATDDNSRLTARVEGNETTLDSDDSGEAVAIIHQLLTDAGIFAARGRA
jgi:hypothetical protein